jgi:hypothetical protein
MKIDPKILRIIGECWMQAILDFTSYVDGNFISLWQILTSHRM